MAAAAVAAEIPTQWKGPLAGEGTMPDQFLKVAGGADPDIETAQMLVSASQIPPGLKMSNTGAAITPPPPIIPPAVVLTTTPAPSSLMPPGMVSGVIPPGVGGAVYIFCFILTLNTRWFNHVGYILVCKCVRLAF